MDRSEAQRLELLKSFTDHELLDELNRRIHEYQGKMQAIMAGMSPPPGTFFKKSQAKAEYWRGWHDYKAAHPNVTVADWRKSRKRSLKK